MKIRTLQHIESEGRDLFINYEAPFLESILLITDIDSIDSVPQNRIRVLSSDIASKLNLRNYIPLTVEKNVSIGPFNIKMIENIGDELFSFFIKDSTNSLLVVTEPPFLPSFELNMTVLLVRAFPYDQDDLIADYGQFFVQKKPSRIYCREEDYDSWISVVHDKKALKAISQEVRQLSLF